MNTDRRSRRRRSERHRPRLPFTARLIYAKRVASLHLIVKLNLMRLMLTQHAISARIQHCKNFLNAIILVTFCKEIKRT